MAYFYLVPNNISLFLFICSATEGHPGCFQLSAVINKAVVNMSEQLFVWT